MENMGAFKVVLIIVLSSALVVLALWFGYRHFVTNQTRDGGRMENPDALKEGRRLSSFRWTQECGDEEKCFSLLFYLEDDYPMLSGSFPSQKSVSALPLSWSVWFDLENTLLDKDLPPLSGDGKSVITIVWSEDGTEKTEIKDGSGEEALERRVLEVVNTAVESKAVEK